MTEKNDQTTDSTTEEEENLLESEEQETQLNPKHRTPALANLVAGYALALGFGILLAFGMGDENAPDIVDGEVVNEGEVVSGLDVLPEEGEIISLLGDSSMDWPIGKDWVDPGYTAEIDGQDYTSFVRSAALVDVTKPGLYKVSYTVHDPKSGDVLESIDRFVTVNDGTNFIHNNPVVYNDRLNGVVVGDDTITTVVGDADRDVIYADNDDRHLRRAGLDLGHGRVEGGRRRTRHHLRRGTRV